MPERCSYDYAVIRVVPRVDRGEFINAGVIVSCPSRGFLQALVMLDRPRLAAFAPTLDLEVIGSHLEAIPRICHGGEEAGPIGKLPQRARFHWLTAPRSTVIQISPAHSGLCEDPALALERLLRMLVLPPESADEAHRPAIQDEMLKGAHSKE